MVKSYSGPNISAGDIKIHGNMFRDVSLAAVSPSSADIFVHPDVWTEDAKQQYRDWCLKTGTPFDDPPPWIDQANVKW